MEESRRQSDCRPPLGRGPALFGPRPPCEGPTQNAPGRPRFFRACSCGFRGSPTLVSAHFVSSSGSALARPPALFSRRRQSDCPGHVQAPAYAHARVVSSPLLVSAYCPFRLSRPGLRTGTHARTRRAQNGGTATPGHPPSTSRTRLLVVVPRTFWPYRGRPVSERSPHAIVSAHPAPRDPRLPGTRRTCAEHTAPTRDPPSAPGVSAYSERRRSGARLLALRSPRPSARVSGSPSFAPARAFVFRARPFPGQ